MRFSPENAFFQDSTDIPFRHYRVALPSNEKPSVSVTNNKLVPLDAQPCNNAQAKPLSVKVSAPFFKDNLWMVDVRVPLYVKQGNSIALRKNFRLNVDFAASSVSGQNPGSRALMLVDNAKAAAQFGVVKNNRTALRREAVSEIDGVIKIAELVVGDSGKMSMTTFREDGLYAIDFKSLLKIVDKSELKGIPLEKLCIYGASPDTLPDMGPGAKFRNPNQLFELPIKVKTGENNSTGNFNEGDTIFFVGYGNAFWKRIDAEQLDAPKTNMSYFHSYSPYSYTQHFILGYKEVGKGLRIEELPAPKSTPKNIEWLRYVRAEKDEFLRDVYYGKDLDWEQATGKEWFWIWRDASDTTISAYTLGNQQPTTDLPGLIPGGKGYVSLTYFPLRSASYGGVRFSEIGYSERMKYTCFKLSVNGTTYSKGKGEEYYWNSGDLLPGGNYSMQVNSLKEKGNEYELTLLTNSSNRYDRFDGYSVAYQWDPSNVSIDSSEWLLPGFATGVIRIPVGKNSDLRLMKFKNYRPVGLLKISDGIAVDSIGKDEDVRYLLYNGKKYRKTISLENIPKSSKNEVQKLSQISSKTEYLIITPEEFRAPAESLAVFRSSDKSISKLVTTIVSVENIYRHYTGGSPSPIAIRNYIAYARSVCPDLKFVLLAGSGHFDYRGVYRSFSKNYIPPFEKESSVTEDFFAVLDSGEVVRSGKTYDLDLAVGRLPVSSVEEFENYVQKAKDYDEISTFNHGEWKSTLLLAADDEKNGVIVDKMNHTVYQENLAMLIDTVSESLGFRLNMKKVYLLDYKRDAAGQKQEAVSDFLNIMNQGALMTLYYGHGSKVAWASEGLLKLSYIPRLTNKKKYTVLNSFSCTVGRFDEGNSRSLTEEIVLAKDAGAIAAIGAARETYADRNEVFAKNFISRALLQNGNYLGVAYMKAKNNIFNHNDTTFVYDTFIFNAEHYVFMGEPIIQMPIANMKITLDSPIDSILALDRMKLSGTVSGMSSGNIALTLREGRFIKHLDLISSDKYVNVPYDGPLIYSEVVPVVGGRFETEFVTPKKLNIGDSLAELRAWAYSPNEKSIGRHLEKNIKIAGLSNYADSLNDKAPPTITIQSCYTGAASAFADNQNVKLQTPACIKVIVEDETALDYREQADEGISFEIVGQENPYHPNPFIQQTSKLAIAQKSLTTEEYPAGNTYTFKVKAQDVLGNVSTKQVNIQITENIQTGLSDVFNVPNPMGKKGTTFYFKDLAVNQSSDSKKVTIFIYNQHGRLVKVLKDAKSGETHWNGTDNYGRLLANGLYHYVVRSEVKTSASKSKTWTKKQKLLISR